MSRSFPRLAVIGALGTLLLASCGGSVEVASGSLPGTGGTAGVDASAGDGAKQCGSAAARTPLNHRPSGSICPQERAAATPDPNPACAGCGGSSPTCICDCTQDSDCTSGPNGRCGQWIPPPVLACDYDECFQDSDCDGGSPCACRPSSASAAPNVCRGAGNCIVDADCGPGGYCSPSSLEQFCSCPSTELCGDAGGGCYVGTNGAGASPPGPGWTQVPCECGDACGHGYFCHSDCDACIDDSDCDGGRCNYSTLTHRFECLSPMCG
jgi:hypothetical protein